MLIDFVLMDFFFFVMFYFGVSRSQEVTLALASV